MTKIITAMNNSKVNEELTKEKNVEVIGKNIQYKEGILELLDINSNIDYIIFEENLFGEIQTEKLIKKIYEKNKKIKIILIIKKENKNEINIKNKNIIKIYYDKEINLKKIKNNKNNINNINNKNIQTKKELYKKNKKEKLNIEEKNKLKQNCKIIYFLGNTKIGKTMTIINIGRCMQDKKYKVLIISSKKISTRILTNTRDNRKRKKGKIDKKSRIKHYSKSKYIITQKKQKIKLKKILLKKVSIKIDKNIMLLKYSKNIKIKDIENFKKIYDFILIEKNLENNKDKKLKLLNNSNKNILIIKPNIIEIKNTKKILEKNYKKNNNKFKIIINNYNKYSIDEKIIKNIFKKNKIIGKIPYIEKYEKLINENFSNKKIFSKKEEIELKKITDYIIQ